MDVQVDVPRGAAVVSGARADHGVGHSHWQVQAEPPLHQVQRQAAAQRLRQRGALIRL